MGFFACMCICVTHASSVPEAGRGCQIRWYWSYRRLWDTVWELGIKLGTMQEQPVLVTTDPALQTPFKTKTLLFLFFLLFVVVGREQGFSMYRWLSWNSLYETRLVSNSQKTACLCLSRAWIKGVSHYAWFPNKLFFKEKHLQNH